MKDKLLQIINHYGIDKQLKYIHSEYFELDESKYKNTKWYNKEIINQLIDEETQKEFDDFNKFIEEFRK